ncbi:MAG TPA: DUF4139 domain-containing protein, partial [Sphingomonadales bacterium]|nr:DUF4139 domain-containing protein [Sphingomonadales bacterium]
LNQESLAMPKIAAAFVLSLLLSSTAPSAETVTVLDGSERTALRITVYNNNFAAVSEARALSVPEGLNRIEFGGVSAMIEPETALLEGGDFEFIEQNFDYDLLSPGKLIEKAVGKQILVERMNPATGKTNVEEATVLSANNGVVLRFRDGIEIFQQGGFPERFAFKEIPANLRAKPTLSTLVNAAQPFQGEVRLSYLTGGFQWKADYVGNLSADEKTMDIQAWVTLSNTSGTDFSRVKLQLVAGEVNRATPRIHYEMADKVVYAVGGTPAREALGDFHLYTVAHPTDIQNNQTKQVALFAAAAVPVEKFYVFDSVGETEKFQPVKVYYEFDNMAENRLGFPVPAGIFRVYAGDSTGKAQFVGESAISNTPENERVILQPGNAFDVTVSEKVASYKRDERRDPENRVAYIETFGKEVTVKNAKEAPVTVRFFEHFYGNWQILAESQKHVEESAREIYWEVSVPAKGEAKLTYTKRTW